MDGGAREGGRERSGGSEERRREVGGGHKPTSTARKQTARATFNIFDSFFAALLANESEAEKKTKQKGR